MAQNDLDRSVEALIDIIDSIKIRLIKKYGVRIVNEWKPRIREGYDIVIDQVTD